MAIHDQRFKPLMREFFREYLLLFYPALAAQLDFATLEWLDKELLTDPPTGEVIEADLLCRLRFQPADGEPGEAGAIHLEVESRDAVAAFPPRMAEYYRTLRPRLRCPVLPVALYLRVGYNGTGVEESVESFGDMEVNRFRFQYVGLPALDAEAYLRGDNWLGVALAALMRMPRERRPFVRAEALRRLATECPETDFRRMLLWECVEAYLTLDAEQQSTFNQLLTKEPYMSALPTMQTTFEKGMEQGMEKGLEQGLERGEHRGMRKAIRVLLTQRFGTLPASVLQRLESWPADQLDSLLAAVPGAASLQSLGLPG